jgi:hypothetical protein
MNLVILKDQIRRVKAAVLLCPKVTVLLRINFPATPTPDFYRSAQSAPEWRQY